MSWLQRYFDMFQGEPVWLVLLVTVVVLAGIFVIVEKVLKLGVWLLIAGVVAALVIFVGIVFVPGCGREAESDPVEALEEEDRSGPETLGEPEKREETDEEPRETVAPFRTPPLVPQ